MSAGLGTLVDLAHKVVFLVVVTSASWVLELAAMSGNIWIHLFWDLSPHFCQRWSLLFTSTRTSPCCHFAWIHGTSPWFEREPWWVSLPLGHIHFQAAGGICKRSYMYWNLHSYDVILVMSVISILYWDCDSMSANLVLTTLTNSLTSLVTLIKWSGIILHTYLPTFQNSTAGHSSWVGGWVRKFVLSCHQLLSTGLQEHSVYAGKSRKIRVGWEVCTYSIPCFFISPRWWIQHP